ncbi:GNAT family N-acetyltransferase [uncultured Cellulomonas sp.]|uniref:GNAT family N-acetyltransferase n=1 Tax=uncultured Cellulomonas sp. TaxID=189682 RepID=UPI0028E22DCB|nr:GNAT family N-acetyltransferase [uncultured Cellulomonas sp.]
MPAAPPPDTVETLRAADIAEAATVLAAALAEDPGFVHLFPVRARRERELRALYRMTLSDAVRYGHAFVTRLNGTVTGAIALYPPGTYPMTPLRWWRQGLRIARIAVNTREHSLGIIRFGDVTASGVPCDAWYVEALGVRPDLQRAGRGKRLMATVFGLIDSASGPSYLETTKPDNVGYYTALGYSSVRSKVPLESSLADGPWIFPMSRVPVGSL